MKRNYKAHLVLLTLRGLVVFVKDFGQDKCVTNKVAEVVQSQNNQADAVESERGQIFSSLSSRHQNEFAILTSGSRWRQ